MRNYLIFQDLTNTNSINNIDKIYKNFKNIYLIHITQLNNYKKEINKEDNSFKDLSYSINNDFKTYCSNLNNTDLEKQYITIINNTDKHYLDKMNILHYKIYLHQNDTNNFIKLLTNIIKNLKKYKKKFTKIKLL